MKNDPDRYDRGVFIRRNEMEQYETIVAIATAMGEGSIGIIRLSGKDSLQSAQKLFALPSETIFSPKPRYATYGKIIDPNSGEMIDEAIFIYMPGPHSYTAEDIVELQLHGSTESLKATLAHLLKMPSVRLAEPGEFTQRAFLNGRLDLSQAEAVMDVIQARTERSLKAAAGQLGGGLSQKIKQVSGKLIDLIAQLEVVIEYPEDSLDETELPRIRSEISSIKAQLALLIESGKEGRILREGLGTAIIGMPNVGKSSLLNFLLGEERAIVTDIPGTTRDVIEEMLSLGGIPIRLIDTAGIRETEDRVEKIGIDRSRKTLEEAQCILMVLDSSQRITEEEIKLLLSAGNDRTLALLNKIDQSSPKAIKRQKELLVTNGFTGPIIGISAQTGEGIGELEKEIEAWVSQDGVLLEGRPMVSNVRQLEALRKGEKALSDALIAIDEGMPEDFILVDLREAWSKVSEITGQAASDEIIHHIFSKFCLGK